MTEPRAKVKKMMGDRWRGSGIKFFNIILF